MSTSRRPLELSNVSLLKLPPSEKQETANVSANKELMREYQEVLEGSKVPALTKRQRSQAIATQVSKADSMLPNRDSMSPDVPVTAFKSGCG